MKTESNRLVHSFNHTNDTEGNFNGLTIREHFALEFAKVHLNAITITSGTSWHGWNDESIANEGIRLADALIEELNK